MSLGRFFSAPPSTRAGLASICPRPMGHSSRSPATETPLLRGAHSTSLARPSETQRHESSDSPQANEARAPAPLLHRRDLIVVLPSPFSVSQSQSTMVEMSLSGP